MSNRQKFEQDLTVLLKRLTKDTAPEEEKKLNVLKDWLIKLQSENVVKINHSVMELVCAKYLIQKGYEVQLEYPLSELLTCDLYAIKGLGNEIVEDRNRLYSARKRVGTVNLHFRPIGKQNHPLQQLCWKIHVGRSTALYFAFSSGAG